MDYSLACYRLASVTWGDPSYYIAVKSNHKIPQS